MPKSWPDNIGEELETAAFEVAAETLKKFEVLVIRTSANIINKSPIGVQKSEGNYQKNWQISAVDNNFELAGSRKNGQAYAMSQVTNKFSLKEDTSLFLFNNLPYAMVIEFGGYIQSPKKGTWNPKTKRYEIRSTGGFSKQAPSGHVRVELRNFEQRLKRL